MCTKVLISPILIWILISSITAEKESTSNPRILKECPLTEYKKFVECAEKLILSPQKEKEAENVTTKSNTSCDKCDCRQCKAEDFPERSSCCQTCCPFVSCETKKCCFKTCHSLCESLECRTSCRKTCLNFVETQRKNDLSEQLNKAEIFNDNSLNITTRINLTNVINNVNNISAPINLRSSNVNDLTIENINSYEESKQITDKPCCQVISPTKCSTVSRFPFVKCQFNKTSQCGDECFNNNRFVFSRPSACSFGNFGCGNFNNLYPIGHILSENSSSPNINKNETVVNTAKNSTGQVLPEEPPAQLILPQQNILPSFDYPPMYTNIYPRQYYNSYIPSVPVNPFFVPRYSSQFISNPFHSYTMGFRNPAFYPPMYNHPQVPQIPMYSNIGTYPSPTQYYFQGMQPFQNLQTQYNYQFPNYQYQTPQITFSPVYTAFAPPQIANEIMPNPTIGFKVQTSNNDAEILITNKEEDNRIPNPV